MSNIPEELRYTKTHEWVRKEENGNLTVGITDHAQELLGDMVFIETPEVGDNLNSGDDCAVVESVKAASDVYCPISGEIVGSNTELADTPEVVNQDPYDTGWLFKIDPADPEEFNELLDHEQYKELIDSESH